MKLDYEIKSHREEAQQERLNNRFFLLRKETIGNDPNGYMTIKELQEDMDKKTGKRITTIDKLERNKILPSHEVLIAYHKYFSVSYDYLMGDKSSTRDDEFFFDHKVYGLNEKSLWNLFLIQSNIQKLPHKIKELILKHDSLDQKIDKHFSQEFTSLTEDEQNEIRSLMKERNSLNHTIALAQENLHLLTRIQMIINFLLSNLNLDTELSSPLSSNTIEKFFESFSKTCFSKFEIYIEDYPPFSSDVVQPYPFEQHPEYLSVVDSLIPNAQESGKKEMIPFSVLQNGLLLEFINDAQKLRNVFTEQTTNTPENRIQYYNHQKENFQLLIDDKAYTSEMTPPQYELFLKTLKKRYGIKPTTQKKGIEGDK